MNENIKSFFKMFISNNELIKATNFKLIFIVLLFFVNVSLLTVPNFIGKMESISDISYLVGIEDSLNEVYDDEPNCKVENAVMICDSLDVKEYGEYNLMYSTNIDDLDTITESTIYLGKEVAMLIYIDENENAYTISGNYQLLEGFDLSKVSSSDFGSLSKDEYYAEVNDYFLTNIFYSTLTHHFQLMYLSQFVQVFLYLIVTTLMFLLMNLKAPISKLSFINANKIVVTSMTGPAFFVAMLGLLSASFASIVFFLLFAVRIMLLYYKMNYSKEVYVD